MADTGRWQRWCEAALSGRREDAVTLLSGLRAALDDGPPYDRAAALDALTSAPAELLLLLDRHARPRSGGGAHRAAPPARGAVPAPAADPLRLLLGSLDEDGRVRGAAVEGLTGVGGPLAVAALALRTVDWVPEVRERATAALVARNAPDEVAAAVRVLLRLDGRSRAGGLVAAYRTVLSDPPHRRAVRALAADTDPLARRFGVQLALDLGSYVRGDLLRTALHDRDQVCRRLCAQRLLELDPDQAGRLMWARGAGVRELAVAALPGDVPATRLVPPLADRARMVRAQARWQLYRRGEPPADVYRKQLRKVGRSTPPRLAAGLAAGLGECGDAADAPLLMRLLGPRERDRAEPWPPMVRRAAVRAVGRLAKPADLVGLLGPLAADQDPGVAREVFEALGRVPDDVPVETLWIGRTRTEPAVRRAAERIGGRTYERTAPVGGAAAGRDLADVPRSSRGTVPGR
ncbi:HEAT repeat domain-containing protein [Actinacidiphila alni]|uniref:HEAT repeat domain-containing protein n=1 Tax=Actinacidiphila alni TaxID=380248 RepID=UPI001FE8AC51|nr:HEAT repeat domain-containing protein [Actinacidiphila alni]